MRRNLARTRDTLLLDNLPPGEHVKLEYRTRFATPRGESLFAIGRLIVMCLLAIPMAFVPVVLPNEWNTLFTLGMIGWASAYLFLYARDYLLLLPRPQHLTYAAGYGLAALASILAYYAYDPRFAYLGVGCLALACTCFVTHAIAKSYAHWMAVNPLVPWPQVQEWKSYWPSLIRLWPRKQVPEGWSPILLAAPVIVSFSLSGYVFFRMVGHPLASERRFASLSALTVMLALPLAVFLLRRVFRLPRTALPITLTANVCWQALVQWIVYDRNQSRAPGLFQFPYNWARRPRLREGAVIVSILLWAVFLATTLGGHIPLFTTSPDTLGPRPSADAVTQLLLTLGSLIFIPVLTFGFSLWITYGPLLARYYVALEKHQAYRQKKEATPWEHYLQRLWTSPLGEAHNHLLLGTAVQGDYPVLLHRAILDQHAHLVGDSGSGKTTLGIIPIIIQLLAAEDCSVVVLDLKGERALFETARLEAERVGVPFKWLTTIPGKSSYVFNPFLQAHWQDLSPTQRTQLLLQGLSLDFGEAYGRSFYTAMNEVVLLTYLRHHNFQSFEELYTKLRDKQLYQMIGRKEDYKNAQHLAALVDRLATIFPLNLDPAKHGPQYAGAAQAAIDARDILQRRQVTYFYLTSPQEPMTSPAIAKLFFYSLFSAAAQLPPDKKHRVYVIVDEFQQVISDSVRLVLEQGRSLGITFILAHQATAQLDRKGVDLRDTVDSCTAFKQIFRVPDVDTMKRLEGLSGDAAYESIGWQQSLPQSGWSIESMFTPQNAAFQQIAVAEQVGPRLERNTIIEVSAQLQASIVRFSHNSGYTQFGGYPFAIVNSFPMTLPEFREREKAAWPAATDETVMVTAQPPPPPELVADLDVPLIDERLAQWAQPRSNADRRNHDSTEEGR